MAPMPEETMVGVKWESSCQLDFPRGSGKISFEEEALGPTGGKWDVAPRLAGCRKKKQAIPEWSWEALPTKRDA